MESRGKRVLNSCGRLTRTRCPLLASSLMPLLPVPLIAGKSRRSLKFRSPLLYSPVVCRSALAESLVLVGGTAMMRGFRARLSQELKSLLATPKYENLKINTFKLFQPPAQLNYVSWLGDFLDIICRSKRTNGKLF